MLNEQTIERLRQMQLDTMAEALRAQENDPACAALSFSDRLGLLVDAEWAQRQSRRLTRLVRSAQLHFPGAAVEDIEYHADRKLDQSLITRLASCALPVRFSRLLRNTLDISVPNPCTPLISRLPAIAKPAKRRFWSLFGLDSLLTVAYC